MDTGHRLGVPGAHTGPWPPQPSPFSMPVTPSTDSSGLTSVNLVSRAGEVRRCGEHPIPQSSLEDRTGQDGVKDADPNRTQDRSFSDTGVGSSLRRLSRGSRTCQEGGRNVMGRGQDLDEEGRWDECKEMP